VSDRPDQHRPRNRLAVIAWCAVYMAWVLPACSDELVEKPKAEDAVGDAATDIGELPDSQAAGDAGTAADDGGAADSNDAADLPDGVTPPGCPAGPFCPCENDKQCDDGDPCTDTNKCILGKCGTPAMTNCDDGNGCTADVCLPAKGCTSTVDDKGPCSDGDLCTIVDVCDNGTCKGTKKRNCNDGNVCTTDKCLHSQGCFFVQNNVECRKANKCTKPAHCSFGACPANQFLPCDDNNGCTTDFCTPEDGCESLPLPNASTACDGEIKWGRCLKAFKKKGTWRQARKQCQAWGGELASVDDKYDNAAVRGQADKACGKIGAWIGLTDGAREWTWQWTDRARYGYRAWNKGEPNNAGNEDYVEIIPGGGWNDLGAKTVLGCFVCARRLESPCNDGDACTAESACDLGKCATATEATDCDDLNPCTTDSCHTKNGCQHKSIKDGSTCSKGTCTKGVCHWPKNAVFTSCQAALAKDKSLQSGVYTLLGTDSAGKATTYPTWCEMGGQWGGGWTLAMQIDGRKTTLNWGSKLWTDKKTHNADKAPWVGMDAKLASWWNVPATEVLVVAQTGKQIRFLTIPLKGTKPNVLGKTLHAILSPGKLVATAVGYKQWKALIPGGSLQSHCHVQGFNAFVNGAGRARIGIIGNNENDCNSPDSWLGLGGYEKMCGNGPVKSAGNIACYWPENGTRRTPVFAWVFVR